MDSHLDHLRDKYLEQLDSAIESLTVTIDKLTALKIEGCDTVAIDLKVLKARLVARRMKSQ